MNRLYVFALMCTAIIFVSGCASHFNLLPNADEFSKSLPELKQQYPELTRYEPSFGRYWFTAISDMPPAQDLVDKWGEPNEWHMSWWNLMLFTVIPPFHPMSRWYWHMGDKVVEVLVDHPIAYGYRPHVFTLEVRERSQ